MHPSTTEEKARLGASRVTRSLELYDRAKELIAGRTHLFGRRAEMHAYGISPIYSDRQQGRRAGPCLKIHAARYRAIFLVANVVAHLHVPRLGHQSFADLAGLDSLYGTNEAGEAAISGPMLYHALV